MHACSSIIACRRYDRNHLAVTLRGIQKVTETRHKREADYHTLRMTKHVRFADPACSICAFVFASFDYRCVTCVTTLTPLLRSKTRAQQLKEIEKDIDIIQVRFVDLQKSAFVFVGITVNLWCLSPLPT